VDVDTGSGFDLNTVEVILMVVGLLGLLVSVLFWSSFSLEPSPDGGRRYGRGETPYRARASALT